MEIMFALLIAGIFAASAIKNFGPMRNQTSVLRSYADTARSVMNCERPKQICGAGHNGVGIYKVARPDKAGIENGIQALLSLSDTIDVVVQQNERTWNISPCTPENNMLPGISYDQALTIVHEMIPEDWGSS